MYRWGLFLKRKILIVISVFLGLFTVILIFWYIYTGSREADKNINTHEVYIASEEIAEGSYVKESQLKKSTIPIELFSSKYVTESSILTGKKVLRDIPGGEIITYEDIEGTQISDNSYFKFSISIPSGLRSLNLPVIYFGEKILINAGDTVDVISSFYDSKNEQFTSETILSAREVILINGKSLQDLSSGEDSGEEISPDTEQQDFLNGILESDSSQFGNSGLQQSLVITFFLTREETEKALNALQLGPLYISLCPGKNFKTSCIGRML